MRKGGTEGAPTVRPGRKENKHVEPKVREFYEVGPRELAARHKSTPAPRSKHADRLTLRQY